MLHNKSIFAIVILQPLQSASLIALAHELSRRNQQR
jgi:hypothetical protein